MGLVSRRTGPAIVAVVAVSAAVACGSFGSDETLASDGGAEGGADGSASGDGDGGTGEAATLDGGCTLLVEDSFDDAAASAARWRLLGSARVMNGEIELVPDQGGRTGAIWMNVSNAPAGRLHVRFTSKIAPANGSDGLAFAWSANQDVGLGGTGGNYGLCNGGADGLAFVLASFGGTVRLLDVSNDCVGDSGPATNVFGTNVVELSATADKVETTIADKPFVFVAPRSVRVRSIGFTAATGGGHARHAVDEVRVEICP